MARRTYETESIRVLWNSERCIHTGVCLRALPEVFDTKRSPWVDVDAADTDAIIQAVEQCPTGALRYERLDGRPGEVPEEGTTITPIPNGPLLVRGQVRVQTRTGNPLAEETRLALCRCGNSQNQPFCDLSHRDAGFRDNPQVVAEWRQHASSPEDIRVKEAPSD